MLSGLPTPVPDEDTAPFWAGCARGDLTAQQCDECRTFRWPPGPGCPSCGSRRSTWISVTGTGTVYSWVVVRVPLANGLAEQTPYCVGLIELDEGIRIVSTISGCDVGAVQPGMQVRADFTDVSEAAPIFTFIPAGSDAGQTRFHREEHNHEN